MTRCARAERCDRISGRRMDLNTEKRAAIRRRPGRNSSARRQRNEDRLRSRFSFQRPGELLVLEISITRCPSSEHRMVPATMSSMFLSPQLSS